MKVYSPVVKEQKWGLLCANRLSSLNVMMLNASALEDVVNPQLFVLVVSVPMSCLCRAVSFLVPSSLVQRWCVKCSPWCDQYSSGQYELDVRWTGLFESFQVVTLCLESFRISPKPFYITATHHQVWHILSSLPV